MRDRARSSARMSAATDSGMVPLRQERALVVLALVNEHQLLKRDGVQKRL